MNEPKSTLLANLIELSRVDGQLARCLAERQKYESEVLELRKEIAAREQETAALAKTSAARKAHFQKEEKKLKEEREKLVARRKALTTLSNYKLQQAAEREIHHASELLDQHEDVLLKTLEENDSLATTLRSAEDALAAQKDKLAALENEVSEALTRIEQREKEYLDSKAQIIQCVDAASLSMYEKVRSRYPFDALAKVEKDSCTACYMNLGPQTTVQILKAESVVRCRGCGRIVFVE